MKVELTEKEIQLLEIIRSIKDASVCIQIAKGAPESVIIKRKIILKEESM